MLILACKHAEFFFTLARGYENNIKVLFGILLFGGWEDIFFVVWMMELLQSLSLSLTNYATEKNAIFLLLFATLSTVDDDVVGWRLKKLKDRDWIACWTRFRFSVHTH